MAYKLPPGKLHTEVLRLLDVWQHEERRSVYSLASALGERGIEAPWLYKLIDGTIAAPDVNKMEVVYEYLSNESLTLKVA